MITITVIIGIVIGAVVIKRNIASENYNSANSNSNNKNLIPEYIKEGITLGGVTGTLKDLDTSDANARPEDIAKGKTAYVNGVKITGTYEKKSDEVSRDKSYVGYYADIDFDGRPDGIIYADLFFGEYITWGNSSFSIDTIDSSMDYKIVNTDYVDYRFDSTPRDVIQMSGNYTRPNRFYIMALEDSVSSNRQKTLAWFLGSSGTLTFNTSNMFGEGRKNTQNILQTSEMVGISWSSDEVWSISDLYGSWFVPSVEEWAAFAYNFKLNSSNISKYNLKSNYWSSSTYGAYYAYQIDLSNNTSNMKNMTDINYVRLSMQF